MSNKQTLECICGSAEHLVPNYRAESRNHPVPWASWYCKKCKESVISCDECNCAGAEWWYDLGMIWEDWCYERNNYSLCQSCHYDAVENGTIEKDEDSW